jgi:hypothetical protein
MDWARAFAAWSPHGLAGITIAVRANLEVAFEMGKGWLLAMTRRRGTVPTEGGAVTGLPWQLEARLTVCSIGFRQYVPIWAAS